MVKPVISGVAVSWPSLFSPTSTRHHLKGQVFFMAKSDFQKTLELRGYVFLGDGSYFKYLEKEWFDRFRPFLTLKNNRWIPQIKSLSALNGLLLEYQEYTGRKAGRDLHRREEMASLVQTENREDLTKEVF
jgi:hypothetical protein